MATLGDRQANWARLREARTRPDLLIVGGGITGAGILREAARLGLDAVLVEQADFAWGTSSRSSRMVHGGLRYILLGDIALTRHSAIERERLIREAPGLVERLRYLIPVRSGRQPGRLALALLLWLYEALAGVRTRGWLDRRALAARVPGIREEGIPGAAFYTDAVTDDARLTLRVLQQACSEGARVLNYVQAVSLLRDAAGDVCGVTLQDRPSGERIAVEARAVVNATGAWVDELRESVARERTIRRLRGSHILLRPGLLPLADALTLFHPEDRRTTFIYPWEGHTVVGTTDLDHGIPLDEEPAITRHELDYLLALAREMFPGERIGEEDIVSSWAGVRPVISSDPRKDPSKETRDHRIWLDRRLLSVSGGKLTTFRLIARDVLRRLSPLLGGLPLAADEAPVFPPVPLLPADLPVGPARARRLLGRFGEEAAALLAAASDGEHEELPGAGCSLAELRWSCRNEQVQHLDDLLLRRSPLGSLSPRGGEAHFGLIGALCRDELGWSEARWTEELARYRGIWSQSRSLPA
ncbi:MAG: glycerol-3-phosphate dehydrogenase/oxidase [Gammaproteobacteria bacterium]